MSKRKYTRLMELLPRILQMQEEGLTHREIEQTLGVVGERPVHHLLKQERRREAKRAAGMVSEAKGRPRKDRQPPKQDIQKELERLRMENKLLRDFLQSTGRK